MVCDSPYLSSLISYLFPLLALVSSVTLSNFWYPLSYTSHLLPTLSISSSSSFFFLVFIIHLLVLGPHCCTGFSLVAVHKLLTVVASRCNAQTPRCAGLGSGAHRLWSTGSVVGAHGLSCSVARGSFPVRDRTHVSCTGRQILTHRVTGEAPHSPFRLECPTVPHTCLSILRSH